MAGFFAQEKGFPDNSTRRNFVFFAYPFAPPIPQADYNTVVSELQTELGLRLWYFLDEVTSQELMRKIWRAILRCDLAIFDVTDGNPNVAFELGLAAGQERPCITLLKTGGGNPLGMADLGYAERAEYDGRDTLRNKLRSLLQAKSSALRLWNAISYQIQSDRLLVTREELEVQILEIVKLVFQHKKITKPGVVKQLKINATNASTILDALRANGVLKVEGQKKGAKYVFTDEWVHHDHEVAAG